MVKYTDDQTEFVHQTRATLESMAHTPETVGVTLDDVVQLNFYIKNVADFRKGADVFESILKTVSPPE